MSFSDAVLKKYRLAGKIAREVREEMRGFVQEAMPVIEVCEKVEKLIRKKGGKPAFPCNVSIDEIAAHYTSPPNDERLIPSGSIVKVDVGVHIDGYIADTAVTICFNPEHENLVRAAEAALKNAVKTVYAGISTTKLGSAIQKTIKSYSCRAISNLTGHQINRYLIHTGKSIPNVSHIVGSRIREGEIIAIEPFVTVVNAAGRVREGKQATIFRFVKRKSLKNPEAQKLLSHIEKNFRTLPFTERWLTGVVPQANHFAAFHELLRSKCLMSYHVFIEASGKPVAQAEHTIFIVKSGCEVLT
ncbi:MAG: type II methionyl aminopeptidase [Candidatus Bathyarchaeota archaeon]|nr:MAG: type II methionyl aminopeptidase [Candidatus Bathyarchaeota archaeon]